MQTNKLKKKQQYKNGELQKILMRNNESNGEEEYSEISAPMTNNNGTN